MGFAQMLDRGLEIAAGQMLQREVQVIVRHLDRDPYRFEVAEVDRSRDQHLVGHHRHLAAQLPLALRGETGGQRRVEQRIVGVGQRGRHVGRELNLLGRPRRGSA